MTRYLTAEMLRLVCFGILAFASSAQGIIARNVSLDFGFGVPHLIFGQGVVKLSDHWQIGLGYGLIPGLAAAGKGVPLGTQNLTLSDGTDVEVSPSADITFNTLLPFVRYFPKENNFYIQATYSMLQLKSDITGPIKTPPPLSATVGLINGNATITQPIPTISVGHVWAGQVYFCDISLGFSFFLPASASVELNSLIPDAFGGSEGNAAQISELVTGIESEVNSSTAQYRTQYPFLPSLSITFGIML